MTTDTASFPQTTHSDASQIDRRSKASIVLNSPAAGTLWFAGWLFTIGFGHLVWWKALLGLVVWPYFLGLIVR